MSRRARGVLKVRGKYRARCFDAHGRRVSMTFARQKDAVAWLDAQAANRVAAELGQPPPLDDPRSVPLFRDYAQEWLDRHKGGWAKSTRLTAERVVETLKSSSLGRMTVKEIDFRAIEKFLEDLGATKSRRSPNHLLGYYEVRRHLVYLRRITKRMMVEFSLPIWPCETVVVPKDVQRRPRARRRALSPKELGRFLAALDSPAFRKSRWRGLLWTLAATGMRPCEVLALRRNRIDFKGARIIVNASAYLGEIREVTKTRDPREPALPPALATVLKEHLQLFPAIGEGLVFPSSRGELARHDSIKKPFRAVLDAAKINPDRVTPYSLRNTFNSIAERSGLSALALRDTLGHVSAEMTERYKRTEPEERMAIADAVLSAARSDE